MWSSDVPACYRAIFQLLNTDAMKDRRILLLQYYDGRSTNFIITITIINELNLARIIFIMNFTRLISV